MFYYDIHILITVCFYFNTFIFRIFYVTKQTTYLLFSFTGGIVKTSCSLKRTQPLCSGGKCYDTLLSLSNSDNDNNNSSIIITIEIDN